MRKAETLPVLLIIGSLAPYIVPDQVKAAQKYFECMEITITNIYWVFVQDYVHALQILLCYLIFTKIQ